MDYSLSSHFHYSILIIMYMVWTLDHRTLDRDRDRPIENGQT